MIEGFRRSYAMALEGGDYFWFAIAHALVAAVTSFVLSLLLSAGGMGVFVALAIASPVALVLSAATVSFVGDIVDSGAGTPGRPPSSAVGGGPFRRTR
ncbi:hypothetical protein [Halopiger goleimassiliensis]|uniref:hypothetical protein n=1 Tax=Halopiger goleimassiliensis TaxID=1293048 RepID=UPI0018A82E4E|nr:hypothetical protein [Halopiger goleimassiliensis]